MPSEMPQLNMRVPKAVIDELDELCEMMSEEHSFTVSRPQALAHSIRVAKLTLRPKNKSGKIRKGD